MNILCILCTLCIESLDSRRRLSLIAFRYADLNRTDKIAWCIASKYQVSTLSVLITYTYGNRPA